MISPTRMAVGAAARRAFELGPHMPRYVVDALLFAAIREAFPDLVPEQAATASGFPSLSDAEKAVQMSREIRWTDDDLTEVVGCLVAPAYGSQAE